MLDRNYVENLVRAALTQIANAPASGVAPDIDRAHSAISIPTPIPIPIPTPTPVSTPAQNPIPAPAPTPTPTIHVSQRESTLGMAPVSVPSKPVYRLDKRLISVADLSGHLSDRTPLALRRGTVITPSAKDWLKQRGIEIEWDVFDKSTTAETGYSSVRRAGIKRLLLVNALTRWDAQPLAAEWVKAGLELESKSFGCLIETTEFLKSELGTDDQAVAVVVTPHTDVALCLFNRQSNLRAIESAQAMTTEQKAAAVGANVLALNGPKLGVFVARQIARHFVGKAPWEIPAALRGILS